MCLKGVAGLFAVCMILPGCAKQIVVPHKEPLPTLPLAAPEPVRSSIQTPTYPLIAQPVLAEMSDIPLFAHTVPWHIGGVRDRTYVLQYKAACPMIDLCAFYRAEMDYFGWQETGVFVFHESCLIFEKPSKQCVVVLRSLTHKECEVTLFIEMKRYKERGLI
jgi:hypothetical protein